MLAFSGSAFTETYMQQEKKSVLMTDDASEITPTFHAKYHKSMYQHPSHLVAKAIFERAEIAIHALKKLESLCKSGISQRDYITALGETSFAVSKFAEQAESNTFQNLKLSIVKTMQLYNNVYDYLMLSAFEGGISRQQGSELDAVNVEKKYDHLVSQSLSDAENELDTSFLILNHCKLQHALKTY
jgi:hypothetical protein